MAISDQLRKAIENSGLSANEIARQTGVTQPTLSRFLRGTTKKLGLDAVDKLAAHFGLELRPADTKPAKKRK